jgi:hypothetical protein
MLLYEWGMKRRILMDYGVQKANLKGNIEGIMEKEKRRVKVDRKC